MRSISASLSLTVETAKGRAPVIAGAGSNSTSEAIDFTRHAKKVGAAAVLVVTPYYNKPTQEGLYQHFKAINDAVDIPIVIYNIPGPLGDRHERRHHDALLRTEERSRRQGRDRQSRARFAAAGGDGPRLRDAVGRGRHGPGLHGARGPRLHFGRLEYCSAHVRRIPERLPCRRLQGRAGAAGSPHAAARCDVLRVQSRTGKIRRIAARPVRSGGPLPLVPITQASQRIVDAALVRAGLIQARAAE